MNDTEEDGVDEPDKEQRVTFGLRGCTCALFGYVLGAVGSIIILFLLDSSNPPSADLALDEDSNQFVAFIFSMYGGVIGALIGIIRGTKLE